MSRQHQQHQQQQQYSESDEERKRRDLEDAKRLKTFFTDMEDKQFDFLDEAGKSIIERIATFLAVLFAVTVFGGNFPPAYLKGSANTLNKWLVIAIMVSYLLAVGSALVAIQPRKYNVYESNVTGMRTEFEHIRRRKKWGVNIAAILFVLGTIVLAWLIVSIIWSV